MTMKNIILGVDKDSSGGAVAIAAEFAKRLDAHVTVVHFGSRATFGDDAVAKVVQSLESSEAAYDIRLEQPITGATIADSLVKMADAIHAAEGGLELQAAPSCPLWRAWFGRLSTNGPGCFALHVDGTAFTEVIVFAVHAGSAPPG
jgi:hypothetical protein